MLCGRIGSRSSLCVIFVVAALGWIGSIALPGIIGITGIGIPAIANRAFAQAEGGAAAFEFADRLIVADDAYGILWQLDPLTGETVGGFSVPADALGNSTPRGQSSLAYAGGELFYTHRGTSRIWVLEANFGTLLRSFPKPADNITGLDAVVANDGSTELVAVTAPNAATGGRSGSFYRFDADSGTVVESRSISGLQDAIAYSASNDAYYFRIGSLEIQEIDVETLAQTRSTTPPAPFSAMAIEPSTGSLFGLTESCLLYRMNPETLAVDSVIGVTDPNGNEIIVCGGMVAAQVLAIEEDEPDDIGDPEEAQAVITVQDSVIQAGSSGRVPFLLTTNIALEGFQIAAAHDPAVLELLAIHTDNTDTASIDPDFIGRELEVNGGTLGVVFDLLPPFEDKLLLPGSNYVVAEYEYRCVESSLDAPMTTEVRLVDDAIGDPPKDKIVIANGITIRPFVLHGRITCEPQNIIPGGPEFFCGGPLDDSNFPQPVEVGVAELAEVCFYYSYPDPEGDLIQGFTMTMTHDCRLACDESSFRIPDNSILDALGADFVSFSCDGNPDDGDGCEIVFAVLVDANPPFDGSSLPQTQLPLLLACVDFQVIGSVTEGECLELRFRDNVDGTGRVPLNNVVALDNHSITPVTHPCEVCVPDSLIALLCGGDELASNGLPSIPTGAPGDEVEVCFWYSAPGEPIHALEQSLRFDCRLDCIPGSFQLDPELEAILGPAVVNFSCDNDPDDGDPCEIVLKIVPEAGTPDGVPLLPAANAPRRLGCVRMRISEAVAPGTCVALEHQDGGDGDGASGDVNNRIEISTGLSEPQVFDCQVCIPQTQLPKFLCGAPELGPDGLPVPVDGIIPGSTVEMCLWYCSPEDRFSNLDELQGVSLALCYNCKLTCNEGSFRIPEDSATAMVDAEFVEFHCDNDPDDGDGCEMVLGILVDLLPPFDGRSLPTSSELLKLACVEMTVSTRAKIGHCLPVEFCDGVNGRRRVPIKNVVSVQNHSYRPELEGCAICVETLGPKFYCGCPELGASGLPKTPTAFAGGTTELCFYYDSPRERRDGSPNINPLQGLLMAVTYDCRLTALEETLSFPDTSATALYGPPDFVDLQVDHDPGDGDGCELILAILMDTQPPFDSRMLPPTDEPLIVACLDFQVPADKGCGDCFEVRFEDGINGVHSIPTFNMVVVDNRSYLARGEACEICIVEPLPEPEFRRADCEWSGEVDLADAAFLVSLLFQDSSWQPDAICLDACDTNDDGRVDLADAHAILAWLFLQGSPPPAPFPDIGVDPTDDKLECPIVEDPCPLGREICRPPEES